MKSQTQNYVALSLALFLLFCVGFFVYTFMQEEATPVVSQRKYRNASADNIVVAKPLPNKTVAQTFTIEGEARGGWYFEASFPIKVTDSNGVVLTTAIAQA